MNYPPAPWRLYGQSYVGVHRFPASEVPLSRLTTAARPVVVARNAFAVTMWVDYQRGSVLEYREFLVGVLCRAGRRLCLTTVFIWVDNVASRDGGRELWGIPKETAKFAFTHARDADLEMVTNTGEPAACGVFGEKLRLPFSIPVPGLLAQDLGGSTGFVRFRSRCRLAFGTGALRTTLPELDFMKNATRVMSVGLYDFHARFGV